MRKNSPRKWLHAILDLLPVILIPVFMVYSHRHQINDYSVTIINDVVDTVNLKNIIDNGYPESLYNYSVTGTSTASYDDSLECIVFSNIDDVGCYGNYDLDYAFVNEHQYLLSIDVKTSNPHVSSTSAMFSIGTDNDELLFEVDISTDLDFHNYRYISTCGADSNYGSIMLNFYDSEESITSYYFNKFQIFDLTSIFGSGNEPALSECDDIFTLGYYWSHLNYYFDYVIGTETINYNDTDIGSQFVYTLYNTTDKYFNMNEVFNLKDFWSWINLNLFGGNAPLMANVVWNIIVYEFVIDLLFVFYGFFMFLIDFVDNLFDRPFNKGR